MRARGVARARNVGAILIACAWCALPIGAAQQSVDGAALYEEHCAVCHGSEGEGGTGPALAGNSTLEDVTAAVRQVLHGGGGMPPFGDRLSGEEIAAVLTHVRTSWGNDMGSVSAERVGEVRDGDDGSAEAGEGEGRDEAEAGAEEGDASRQVDDAAEDGAPADDEVEEAREDGAAAPADDRERQAAEVERGEASLTLQVRPEEAEVEIEGPPGFETVRRGGGDHALEGLPPGPYRVTVLFEGERYLQVVDLTGGGHAEATFELVAGER